jgi:hypothetical protein
MQDVMPGDVLLYAVTVREKGVQADFYGCEVVGSIPGGRPLNADGEPVTGVRAIYRRNRVVSAIPPGRILVARQGNDPDEKSQLSRELERIYGPGELVTSLSCQCESACSMLKKRL